MEMEIHILELIVLIIFFIILIFNLCYDERRGGGVSR